MRSRAREGRGGLRESEERTMNIPKTKVFNNTFRAGTVKDTGILPKETDKISTTGG